MVLWVLLLSRPSHLHMNPNYMSVFSVYFAVSNRKATTSLPILMTLRTFYDAVRIDDPIGHQRKSHSLSLDYAHSAAGEIKAILCLQLLQVLKLSVVFFICKISYPRRWLLRDSITIEACWLEKVNPWYTVRIEWRINLCCACWL